jgi:putative transposase
MSIYKSSTGCVHLLNLHFVWCTKYRRKVLSEKIQIRLKEIIESKARELSTDILALEVMPDHVHCFVSVPPTDAPQHFVSQFKGYTSRILRKEFPELVSRLPTLWSRAYFVCSAGNVSSEIIEQYIKDQKNK